MKESKTSKLGKKLKAEEKIRNALRSNEGLRYRDLRLASLELELQKMKGMLGSFQAYVDSFEHELVLLREFIGGVQK